ncbi:MAG: cell wall-binding repeat-containing protein, partial [Gracilibacteraceae bacterium]|nr:cell wall-binding repeat-containing protein [Gracilibacteraceae bacterium]
YFAQTQWWTTANEEGFIVVIHGQDYQNRPGSNAANNNNPQGVTDSGNTNNSSANYWRSLKELIKSGALDIGAEVDWGRVYASGYSLGANTITTMLMFGSYPQHKEFAALFDQSAGTFTTGASGPITGELIPVILDAGTPDVPALHMEPWADNVADTGTGSSIMVAPPSSALYTNVLAITALNGIGFSFNATSDLEASRQSYIDNLEAIGGSFYQSGRFVNSAFKNWQTFELFRFTRVLGREHNPVPEEMRRGWEYLSRFSIDQVTGDRYYSPSAFKVAGDETKILAAQPSTMTVTFDANGGSSATQTITVNAPGKTVGTLPSAPLRGGYRFMGWNRVASGAGEAFDANTVVPGDITVYAQWRSVTPNGGSSGGGSAPVQPTPPAPTPGSGISKADLTYISGANRVATSVAIAKNGWTSADTVVLAQSLIDSLAATPLAFQNNAPILLTTGALDPAVLAEIQELGAAKVIVTGAVNPEVIAALKAALPNLQIEQSTGANRFETVALLNQQISDPKGVFVIGYDAIPDAMSVASWAAANGFLIEVAQSDGSYTPSAKAQGLTGYIIGGPALVRDIAGFTRLYGADRYATNLKVRQTLSFDYSVIYTANGGTLVDALTGSVLAAKTKSTIVLLPDGDPTGVDFGAITADTKIYSFGGSM